jgi:hypothetical protein
MAATGDLAGGSDFRIARRWSGDAVVQLARLAKWEHCEGVLPARLK